MGTSEIMQGKILSLLPNMSPSLVTALRNSALESDDDVKYDDVTKDKINSDEMIYVGKELKEVTETKLKSARELLSMLLDCGEIRKLGSEISKASKQGLLDMAFFTVMNMNIMDAYREQEQPTTKETEGDEQQEPTANRYQILQHLYKMSRRSRKDC